MDERVKPLRFAWLKRVVVVAEVALGSLLLAWVSALMFQFFVRGGVPGAELDDVTRSLATMLLTGAVLFLDGLRRGRRWM